MENNMRCMILIIGLFLLFSIPTFVDGASIQKIHSHRKHMKRHQHQKHQTHQTHQTRQIHQTHQKPQTYQNAELIEVTHVNTNFKEMRTTDDIISSMTPSTLPEFDYKINHFRALISENEKLSKTFNQIEVDQRDAARPVDLLIETSSLSRDTPTYVLPTDTAHYYNAFDQTTNINPIAAMFPSRNTIDEINRRLFARYATRIYDPNILLGHPHSPDGNVPHNDLHVPPPLPDMLHPPLFNALAPFSPLEHDHDVHVPFATVPTTIVQADPHHASPHYPLYDSHYDPRFDPHYDPHYVRPPLFGSDYANSLPSAPPAASGLPSGSNQLTNFPQLAEIVSYLKQTKDNVPKHPGLSFSETTFKSKPSSYYQDDIDITMGGGCVNCQFKN